MTPEQIQQAQAQLKQQGYVPPASSGQPVSGYDQIDAAVAKRSAAPEHTNSFSGVAHAIGSDFDKRIDNTAKIESSNDGFLSKTLQIAGQGAGAVNDTIGDVVKSAIKPEVMKGIGEHLAPLVNAAKETPAGQAIIDWWNNLHPETQRNLSATGNIAVLLSNAVGGGAAKTGVEAVVSDAGQATIKNAIEPVVSKVMDPAAEAIAKAKGSIGSAQPNDLETIAALIQPKTTAKEAMSQGLLYQGKKGGFFSRGPVDKIAATAQDAQSARTIQRLIKDAAKMDEQGLYSALDDQITSVAKNLEPAMKATPIKRETIQMITDDLEKLQKEQLAATDGTKDTLAVIKKSQTNFQGVLENSGSKNMNDLWDAAKAYDKSVAQNVKNATEMSPEKLQLQKALWLQNRAILRNAINDSANGLGETSRSAFSDMRDMYSAQDGLLSRAKINTEGDASGLEKFGKTTTGKVLKAGAKAAGIGAGIHLVP